MTATLLWNAKRFPMIYDGGKPTAVIVDLQSFEQIEIVLDNLANREAEPEDELIAQSETLRRLTQKVVTTAKPLADWEKALNEL